MCVFKMEANSISLFFLLLPVDNDMKRCVLTLQSHICHMQSLRASRAAAGRIVLQISNKNALWMLLFSKHLGLLPICILVAWKM